MSKENVVYVTKERMLSCPKREGNPIRVIATTWMNPQDIMLSEISQSQKDKYSLIPLMWGF